MLFKTVDWPVEIEAADQRSKWLVEPLNFDLDLQELP